MKIPFAAIQLTNKCNLNCEFCFRRRVTEEPFSKIENIIKNLRACNVKSLVLSGGEPLLREDIKKILQLCKKLGIETVLQSNGLILKSRLPGILPYIDWISLSLDGDTAEKNSLMRTAEQFKAITEILPILKKKNINVKLGTVVSKKNYKNIENIGKLVGPYVTTWKLYQFYPRLDTTAGDNQKQFIIGDKLFEEVSKKIKNKFPDLHISTHTIKEFNESPCLLIDPDGKVYITKKNKDILIGDMANDPKEFIENYQKMDIASQIEKNFEKTYKA